MYFDTNTFQWILAGITSYGNGCGHSNFAGIYTRVSVYHEWIESVLNRTSSSSVSLELLFFIFIFDFISLYSHLIVSFFFSFFGQMNESMNFMS